MTGAIEGAADAATGALLGRAVEPGHGEATHGHGAHGHCLNCGAALIGPHCHVCGQSAHVHRTMGAIGHELAHGVFHFEGKIWRTLPMLVMRPGELTRRYVHGERARFVSPLAIFLFTVFLMFTVVANLPGWQFGDAALFDPGVAAGMAQARTKLADESARADAAYKSARAALDKERAEGQPDPQRVARYERRVADAAKARAELAEAQAMLPIATTFDVKGASPTSNENWLEAKFRHAKDNPAMTLYKIKTSAYKYSWALIPISLPFIWLLFPLRREVGMYDHAVFATYSLTFMSLLTVVVAVLSALGMPQGFTWSAAVFIPPVHIYKQLKGAYRLNRLGALWRTFLLLNFALIAAIFFVVLLAYLGVAD